MKRVFPGFLNTFSLENKDFRVLKNEKKISFLVF